MNMQITQTETSPRALLKLNPGELLIGMYVSELDQPWVNTSFPVGGFHVKKAEQIETLQRICRYVIIDLNQGTRPKKQRKALNNFLDWPNHSMDLFIRVVQENNGRLSANKRKSHFNWMTEEEISKAEETVRIAFAINKLENK